MEINYNERQQYFDRWFVTPLKTLQEIPNGDGGFAALAISCALYERYAAAGHQKNHKKDNADPKIQKLSDDFNIEYTTAKLFWSIFRDGLTHQGMPKQSNFGNNDLPGYILHHDFPNAIAFCETEQKLHVQPWRFTDKVLELCQADINLLFESESFPFPTVR